MNSLWSIRILSILQSKSKQFYSLCIDADNLGETWSRRINRYAGSIRKLRAFKIATRYSKHRLTQLRQRIKENDA